MLPRVGALVEGPAFHPYLTGPRQPRPARRERRDRRPAHVPPARPTRRSSASGSSAAATKPYRQYSLGMKQRLGLAAALLRPRELLVLDEPTNGLDPQGTREVRHLVRELADDGTTVLVSSHLLAEIEQVCSHIGIMGRGRLLLQGDRASSPHAAPPGSSSQTSADHVGAAAEVLTGLGLPTVEVDGATVAALLDDTPPEKVSAALVHAGVDLLGPRGPSAEPRADLRRADRGGLRCRSLSRGTAVGPRPRRPRSPGAQRAAARLRPPPQPRPARSGSRWCPCCSGTVLFAHPGQRARRAGARVHRQRHRQRAVPRRRVAVPVPAVPAAADHRHRVRRRRSRARRPPARCATCSSCPSSRTPAARASRPLGALAFAGAAVLVDRRRRARRRGGRTSGCATSRCCPAPPCRCATASCGSPAVVVYVGLSMTGLVAVGLFFSTLTEVPVGAMAATVVVAIVSRRPRPAARRCTPSRPRCSRTTGSTSPSSSGSSPTGACWVRGSRCRRRGWRSSARWRGAGSRRPTSRPELTAVVRSRQKGRRRRGDRVRGLA